jgi:hypothetical protein
MNQEYIIQQFNMVQTSKIKMEKDKITLMALTLTITIRAKTITMFFLEKSFETPFENFLHFFEFGEVLKQVTKNVEKVKAKNNEPSPLEFDDDKVF